MKATKMFDGEKRLKDIYVGATRWEVIKYKARKLWIFTLTYSFFAFLLYIGFMAGIYASPIVAHAEVKPIVPVESTPKILSRIAQCESGGSHYNKAGQVLVVGNTDKSVDVGKFQINMKYWGAKATELGYDLFDEEDNYKMAKYLFENFGSEPWIWSKACWNK